MSKYSVTYIVLFLSIFTLGVFPVINGAGCNAVIDMDISYMHVSGRCENGQVNITYNNKSLDEIYTVSGRMLVLGEQHFILVDSFRYLKNNENENVMKRYLYKRKIISGRIINNRYVLTYSPFPLMGIIKINGRLSLF